MPAFFILIFLAAGLLWLFSSSWFKPFGSFGYKLWKDAKDAMTAKDENKNEKEQKVNE